MKHIADLIARILIAAIFLYEAVDSIIFFRATKETMTSYGIEWNQNLLLIGAIILLFLGGLLILLGYRMGLGGFLVLAYWIPVTFIVHAFWTYPADEVRLEAMIFAKNLAIVGGVLMLMIKGSGKYSLKRLMPVTRIPKGET
ncbi:MAG: DoxX family membrane protein [Saprospiraceae bacterium]|nr:DoxX family membrane protein [Saprospiraceae bacterium]